MIRVAIQKSGRLHDRAIGLLAKSGVDPEWRHGALVCRCDGFPMELMLVRDDDIPEYVQDNVCQLGVVGQNVLEEKLGPVEASPVSEVMPLGFGHCRLAIAAPKDSGITALTHLHGRRIATSYPNTLERHLAAQGVKAHIVTLSGSVEIAPSIGVADAVCDLVSTGGTLASNGLEEVEVLTRSQAVLIRTRASLSAAQEASIEQLVGRFTGVLTAQRSKYVMMNAPASAVAEICRILPGMEAPTVIPLQGRPDRVAVHAVAPEEVFWETVESLKKAGAESILVSPIEKIIS